MQCITFSYSICWSEHSVRVCTTSHFILHCISNWKFSMHYIFIPDLFSWAEYIKCTTHYITSILSGVAPHHIILLHYISNWKFQCNATHFHIQSVQLKLKCTVLHYKHSVRGCTTNKKLRLSLQQITSIRIFRRPKFHHIIWTESDLAHQ